MERAGGVAGRADALVGRAGALAEGAGGLLDTYQPIAAQAAPLARRFVQEFSEDELVAAIRLVDQLPRLTEHMESDIMPLLATLDRVGPDVHELLNQLREVRQAIQGIPGFRLLPPPRGGDRRRRASESHRCAARNSTSMTLAATPVARRTRRRATTMAAGTPPLPGIAAPPSPRRSGTPVA